MLRRLRHRPTQTSAAVCPRQLQSYPCVGLPAWYSRCMDDWERKQAANKRDERANALEWMRGERVAYQVARVRAESLGCAPDCEGGKVDPRGVRCECALMRRQERVQSAKTVDMMRRGVG